MDARKPSPSAGERLKELRVGLGLTTRDVEAKSQSKADAQLDRKSTRLNSSHQIISYAVFCLKKKKKQQATSKSTESQVQQNNIIQTHRLPSTQHVTFRQHRCQSNHDHPHTHHLYTTQPHTSD